MGDPCVLWEKVSKVLAPIWPGNLGNCSIIRQCVDNTIALAERHPKHETLQLEIIAVLESLNRLRESPDYELCQVSEQKPGVLEELAAERKKVLEKESAELEKKTDRLAEEIKELSGQAMTGIT